MNVCGIATANNGDLEGREAVHDSATKVSSKLADTHAIVTASTLSESSYIPNTSRAAKTTVNTRIKAILTRKCGTHRSIEIGSTGRTLDITVTTPLATPFRDGQIAFASEQKIRKTLSDPVAGTVECTEVSERLFPCSILLPDYPRETCHYIHFGYSHSLRMCS
jgi:hypothetical protein